MNTARLGVILCSVAAALTFDLPAQDLSSALRRFAAQANVDILFPADAVADRSAPALKGRFEPDEALTKLLVYTDLTFKEVAPGIFVVKPQTGKASVNSTR